MIYEVTMYSAKCDNCGTQWKDEDYSWVALTDESSLKSQLRDEGWYTQWLKNEDKHYCPECFCFDDDDNLILKKNKEPTVQASVASKDA